MGIGPITTRRSGSDDRALGSRHAVSEAHPGTLDAAAFANAEGVVDGVVPSMYPIAKDGDLFVPYDPTPDTGNTLYGFSLGLRDVNHGDETTAVIWHGRIIVAFLPVDFEPPADAGAFVYEN